MLFYVVGPDFLPLLEGFTNIEKSVSGNNKNKAVKLWVECKAEFSQVWMLYYCNNKRFLTGQEKKQVKPVVYSKY